MKAKLLFVWVLSLVIVIVFALGGVALAQEKKKKSEGTEQKTEASQEEKSAAAGEKKKKSAEDPNLKKIAGDIGWLTMDKKTLVLVKDGKHIADIEIPQGVEVKVVEIKVSQKPGELADAKSGNKVEISYVEEGGKKLAKTLVVTPVVWGGEDEE